MENVTDINEEVQPVEPKISQKKWIRVALAAICIAISILGYYFIEKGVNTNSNSIIAEIKEEIVITPTPLPFAEITIPYLREREYKSELNDRTIQYENGNYNAFLTSYNSDGLRVNGLLTIPTSEQPKEGWPAIIFVHGYIPPAQYQTTQQYYDYVDYLARNGFVVFKIDLRGHGESEGTAGGGYYSADYVIDTLNAYSALQNADFVNQNKIGLWGHSMAGNVVMRSAAVKPEISAVVIWGGAVYTYEDMQKYRINDTSYQRPPEGSQPTQSRQRMREIHGEPDLNNPFWQQLAPVTYLKDLQGAVQLNHAVNDDVVNIGYSRDLAEYLKKEDTIYELHEYESGGHNISGSSFVEAMENTVEFYNKYLQVIIY